MATLAMEHSPKRRRVSLDSVDAMMAPPMPALESTPAWDCLWKAIANEPTTDDVGALVGALSRADLEQSAPDELHKPGDTLLCHAARHGHLDALTRLLAAGACCATPNREGFSPLLLACASGHLEPARALHAAGADVPSTHPNGFWPMFTVCALGHVRLARWLAAEEDAAGAAGAADAGERADRLGRTALMAAAGRGHLAVVRFLCEERGADAQRANAHGAGALMYAAAHGHAGVVLYLADRARADLARADAAGFRAFDMACHHGHLDVVKLLAARGACDGAADVERSCARLRERGHDAAADWLAPTRGFSTPLHYLDTITAAECRALLRAGADVRARGADDASAASPLDVARDARWAALPTASLVRRAAAPWSAENHELFPAKERERVPGYLLVGRQLSARAPRGGGALWECWVSHVMAFAVGRD